MPYTLDELNDLPQDEVLQILCEAHGTALSRSERAAMVRDNCQAKDAIAMIERPGRVSRKGWNMGCFGLRG